jgi:hypothetical protein
VTHRTTITADWHIHSRHSCECRKIGMSLDELGDGTAVFCRLKDGEVTVEQKVRPNLEGEGRWTGQYANPGNTGCLEDRLVKGPFRVLWYGEPGPAGMVERHGRAAAPLAADGLYVVAGASLSGKFRLTGIGLRLAGRGHTLPVIRLMVSPIGHEAVNGQAV